MVKLTNCEGFEWDAGNRDKNRIKHGVTEGECEEVFFNSPLLVGEDFKHSDVESRYVAFGMTNSSRLLTVIFTSRKKFIRVISARDMHKKEREFYRSL